MEGRQDGGRSTLFVIAWRSEDTPESLKAAYQAERDPQRRTSASGGHGLWLLRSGWPLEAVAQAVGVHYRTVQSA